ncbi:MAG: flagellar type III secretion system pore protein FliP [Deltaproteobacteria bacterium]|jgi:flagellar biosynthetic protein FliP|nr:flagellar type III secretion system pore protein FliP [Deltaproteobacteria bacterium]
MNPKTSRPRRVFLGFFGAPTLGLKTVFWLMGVIFSLQLALAAPGFAQTGGTGNLVPIPTINLSFDQADDPDRLATVINVLFLLTVLALAPSILVMMTSFVRIVVVFGFLRQAMGTQQTPPNQVIVSLALFLTFYLMLPVWRTIENQAFKPYMANEISQSEAIKRALDPVREFMFAQTRAKDLALFMRVAGEPKPLNKAEVPTMSLIPAFIISELKTAFTIGFLLYMPFLVIDMVVASVLLSMGMMMLPPVMISLPFKLMLFVLVDGWNLLAGSIVRSFGPLAGVPG